MKIFERFKIWFGIRGASRKLHKVKTQIDVLEARRVASMAELENRQRELERLRDRMDADLDEARKIHMRMEFALEEERERVKVLETTIETLVASHKLLIERYDAETAVESRRRAAMSVGE